MKARSLLQWLDSVADHPRQHWVFLAWYVLASITAIVLVRVVGGPGLWRFMWDAFIEGGSEALWFWMTLGGLLQPSTWAASERMWARYEADLAARETGSRVEAAAAARAFLDHCHRIRRGLEPSSIGMRFIAWPSWPGVLRSYLATLPSQDRGFVRDAVEAYLAFVQRSHRAW